MHEERFVVEVSEPVSSAEVAAVADRIALHLHMDAARVLKLLDGRTGPVTKPVLREKADIIATTFEDAGVVVLVRPAPTAPKDVDGDAFVPAPDAAPQNAGGDAPEPDDGVSIATRSDGGADVDGATNVGDPIPTRTSDDPEPGDQVGS